MQPFKQQKEDLEVRERGHGPGFTHMVTYSLWATAVHSQNHRMVGVGRDLCGSPSPTSCRSRVTYSRLHRTASRGGLNISIANTQIKTSPFSHQTGEFWLRAHQNGF